jgi:hypothetical protein
MESSVEIDYDKGTVNCKGTHSERFTMLVIMWVGVVWLGRYFVLKMLILPLLLAKGAANLNLGKYFKFWKPKS